MLTHKMTSGVVVFLCHFTFVNGEVAWSICDAVAFGKYFIESIKLAWAVIDHNNCDMVLKVYVKHVGTTKAITIAETVFFLCVNA